MVVAKTQRRDKPVKNRTKVGLRTGVRTSGKNKQLSWLVQFTWDRLMGRRQKYKRRKRKRIEAYFLFQSFGLASPDTSRMYFPLLANKTEL